MFDSSDAFSILGFLPTFQMACGINEIHEMPAMWLFHFYKKRPAGATLRTPACVSSSSHAREVCELKSYCKFVNYLLATYITDDINTETNMDTDFNHPAVKAQLNMRKHSGQKSYATDLSTTNTVSKETFNEGLRQSIQRIV